MDQPDTPSSVFGYWALFGMGVVITVVTLCRGVQSELSGVLPVGVVMIVVSAYLALKHRRATRGWAGTTFIVAMAVVAVAILALLLFVFSLMSGLVGV